MVDTRVTINPGMVVRIQFQNLNESAMVGVYSFTAFGHQPNPGPEPEARGFGREGCGGCGFRQ